MAGDGQAADFDAVILAGGAAARMNGADKPALHVGGTAMVVSVARAAAAAGARRLVVVGPLRPGLVQSGLEAAASVLPGGLVSVREEPPGGGPVPALRRGLAEVTSPWVALLAADLPFLTGTDLTRLLQAAVSGDPDPAGPGAAGPGPAGAVLTDRDGRQQWLASVWLAAALRQALTTRTGGSLGGMLGPLGPVLLPPGEPAAVRAAWLDCDTPADLASARAEAED